MESPSWSPVDCPACGAAAETNDARITGSAGLDLTCLCGLRIVAGAIVARGTERTPEDVGDLTWWPPPPFEVTPAYRAPGERRHVLALVPVHPLAADARVPTSAAPPAPARAPFASRTIRFKRARRSPDATR